MQQDSNLSNRKLSAYLPAALAATIALGQMTLIVQPAMAGPGDINSTNNGQNVGAGTYYNTPDGKTVFTNTGSGGLFIKAGDTVRGLESSAAGVATGNGGTMYFRAPGSVVRVDGNIDVSGIIKGGAYIGNGGRVFIDSAYLQQNGNIFANGINGGLVQFNVGSMTLGPNARIEAKGFGNGYGSGGNGGQVFVNASGVVNLQKGSIVDTSGKVVANYDTNVINIEGSVVNVQGVLRANGIAQATPGSGLSLINSTGSAGGTIRLVAAGTPGKSDTAASDCADCAIDSVTHISNPLFTPAMSAQLKADLDDLSSKHDGKLIIGSHAKIDANGANGASTGKRTSEADRKGQDGGSILMSAVADIDWSGSVNANGGNGLHGISGQGHGGNGGTIAVSSFKNINFSGEAHAIGGNGYQGYSNNVPGGVGGKGGVIGFSYGGAFNNTYVASKNHSLNQIDVRGGNNAIMYGSRGYNNPTGGLVVFSGTKNPTRFDNVSVNGGREGYGLHSNPNSFGTIVAPEFGNSFWSLPSSVRHQIAQANPFFGGYTAHIAKTANNEILMNGPNFIVLSKGGPLDLGSKISSGTVRTVDAQNGTAYIPYGTQPRNLFISSLVKGDMLLNLPCHCALDFDNLHTMTVSNAGGGIINPYGSYWKVGIFDGGKDQRAAVGGGHLSWLAKGDIINSDHAHILSYGNVAGGSVHLSSTQGSIYNKSEIALIADPYSTDYYPVHHHAGSIILKAGKDIVNSGVITDAETVHTRWGSYDTTKWGIGEVFQAHAGNDFINKGRIIANGETPILSKSVVWTRHGLSVSPLSAWGGIIVAGADRNALNLGHIQSNGNTRPDSIFWHTGEGNGGYVHLHGGNVTSNGLPYHHSDASIEAEGSRNGGKVLLTAAGNDQGGLGSGVVSGFSVTKDGVRTGVNLSTGESAWNFGKISVKGGKTDGTVILAGDQQAGVGKHSSINGVKVGTNLDAFFAKSQAHGGTVKLLAGKGIVKNLLCNTPLTPITPNTPDSPLTPVTPDSPSVSNGKPLDYNILGLFQQQRYWLNLKMNRPETPFILAMQKPGMFLAKKYSSVTEEILKLALYEYNRELSQGETQNEAYRVSVQYLRLAGIDSDTAKQLIVQIKSKEIKADPAVITLLDRLSTELDANARVSSN